VIALFGRNSIILKKKEVRLKWRQRRKRRSNEQSKSFFAYKRGDKQ